ncbi:MAG: thiol:disulfide interchange protein DsbA/DsbL [Pseudomonadota bacterium]
MIFSPAAATFAACCLAFLLSPLAADAQDTPQARVNHEYRLIDSRPAGTSANIEVVEFFWYGCPYCHELQPSLAEWLKRKPADVTLLRVPALLGDDRVLHARIYYALEMLGELERLHQQVYRSYHLEKLPMSRPDVMSQWAVRQGIDRERWLAAYNSGEVTQKIRRAQKLTRAYDVQGTPSIVVDDRYLTSSGMAGGVRGVMPVVDDLIHIARQQRAGK